MDIPKIPPKSLPGFDPAADHLRLTDNKRLYRKLLLDFGTNYGKVAGEIRETLKVGDFGQTHSDTKSSDLQRILTSMVLKNLCSITIIFIREV
jgi:hypothetical protein